MNPSPVAACSREKSSLSHSALLNMGYQVFFMPILFREVMVQWPPVPKTPVAAAVSTTTSSMASTMKMVSPLLISVGIMAI